jgi:aminoglycoside phosphotransferase (APT) family kinase protein
MHDLAAVLGDLLGGEVVGLVQLSGGASRETWSFDLHRGGEVMPLILQRAGTEAGGPPVSVQATLLRVAASRGVPVAEPVHVSEETQPLGSPFIVLRRVDGETIARRILRDPAHAQARACLVAQCAQALARLHAADPDHAVPAIALDEPDQLTLWRDTLDRLGHPHPAFEIALRWLDAHRPASSRRAIVHGDFRLGNFVIGPEGLNAVLDWELAHRGDPLEDLGWLCVKAWRFGSSQPVAGLCSYEELIGAYENAGGQHVDRAALHWWETLGTLKWGVICILQADKHLSGVQRSVELAAIGRRVCENEWDVLDCIGAPRGCDATTADQTHLSAAGDDLHGRPTTAELLEAVREFLTEQAATGGEGRARLGFQARVAANAVAIVEREMRLRAEQEAAHAAGLARLGVASEAELAAAIRSGALDDRMDEVIAVVRQTVAARLAVANPGYAVAPANPREQEP